MSMTIQLSIIVIHEINNWRRRVSLSVKFVLPILTKAAMRRLRSGISRLHPKTDSKRPNTNDATKTKQASQLPTAKKSDGSVTAATSTNSISKTNGFTKQKSQKTCRALESLKVRFHSCLVPTKTKSSIDIGFAR